MSDLFNLGQLLRNRYVRDLKFLDPAKFEDVVGFDRVAAGLFAIIHPLQVYFRSVDDYRALTQTQAVQAAMAPSTEKVFREVKDWPSDWEPIALHTIPEQEDYVSSATVTFQLYKLITCYRSCIQWPIVLRTIEPRLRP